jgi:hypothetical protein
MAIGDVRYFSGQGRVYSGILNTSTGQPTSLKWLGNVTNLALGIDQTYQEHKESYTGQRNVDLRFRNQNMVSVDITLDSTVATNWALALKGTNSTAIAGTVTAEALVAPPLGDFVPLSKKLVSASGMTVTGTAGTPTYVAGTDYKFEAPNLIQVPASGSAITAALAIKANYSYLASETIKPLLAADTNIFLQFSGLNTVEGNNPVLVEVFKLSLNAATQLALITENLVEFQMTGMALYDPLNAADGGFFRVTQTQQT